MGHQIQDPAQPRRADDKTNHVAVLGRQTLVRSQLIVA
jgi:hypothetical protein